MSTLKHVFAFPGQLGSEAFQNGAQRRDAGTFPPVLHIGPGNDDQDQFAVRKDPQSERTQVAAALAVGDAVPLRHPRGGSLW